MPSIQEQIDRAQGGTKLSFTVFSPKHVKENEFLFRPLPYKLGADNNPFIEVHIHNNIGKEKKEYAMCPSKMLGEDCPYCSTAKELKDSLDPEEWKKIAKKFYPGSNVYIPGIARYDKYSEFGFLKISAYQNFQQQVIGILTNKQLKKLFKLSDDVKFINIWDLKSGLDLVVKKLEKSKENMYERFIISNELELTPAVKRDEEKQMIAEYWKNTPDIVTEMITIWGCTEKINGIFSKQHPDHAVKLGLISKDDMLPEAKNEEAKNEEAKNEEASTEPSLPSSDDDVEKMINEQIASNDESQTKDEQKSEANPGLDDEYTKLMEELNN